VPDDQWGQWPPPPGSPAPPPPPGEAAWGPQGTPPAWSSTPPATPPAPPAWPSAPAPLPVHRPGAFPLRPLTLGDIFDGAFRIIRHNAGATVGASILVAAASMLLPVLISGLVTFGGWGEASSFGSDSISEDLSSGTLSRGDGTALAVVVGSVALGTVLQSIGLLFVTAMGARVTAAAAIGRKLRLGEAWAQTRGTRWRLLGLTVLLGVASAVAIALYLVPLLLLAISGGSLLGTVAFGLLGGLALVCVLAWGWIRIAYLSTAILVLERQGIGSALSRSLLLTRHSFWRVFGIGLLTAIAAVVAAQVASMPLSLLTGLIPAFVGDEYGVLASVLGQAASGIVSAALTTPFLAVVAALQYHDQRIRKEAFDVVLMELAGHTGDPAR
jgi:hypothetical protein